MKPYSEMTKAERLQYMATGRVTVGTITTVEDHSLKKRHVGKVRGRIVSGATKASNYRFETPQEARKNAEAMRELWRNDLAMLKKVTA